MTEMVRADEAQLAATPHAADELIVWAQAARAANELARPLCETSFVPVHFHGKPGEATAAIMLGAEVGLSPLQALAGIYVISGKPAMYARTLMAVVLGAGHEVWTESASSTEVTVCGRRRGTEHVERVTWTIERARKAGYTKNQKYSTDPESMLLARAQSDVCRRVAPDALLGMPYTVEEIQDDGEQPTAAKRRVSRNAKPETPHPESAGELQPGRAGHLRKVTDTDLPPLPGEDVHEAEVVPDCVAGCTHADGPGHFGACVKNPNPEPFEPTSPFPSVERAEGEGVTPTGDRPGMMTKPQGRMLFALLRQQGVTERQDCLDFVNGVLGTKHESSTDITKTQAMQLLDHLSALEKPAEDDPEPGFDDDGALPYKDN
jgi:hypothetical protein